LTERILNLHQNLTIHFSDFRTRLKSQARWSCLLPQAATWMQLHCRFQGSNSARQISLIGNLLMRRLWENSRS